MKVPSKIDIVIILVFSGLAGFMLALYQRKPNDLSLHQNPVMQTFHYPARFVKQLANDPDAGRKIFNEFCAACHSEEPAIDVNAPLIGDKKIWQGLRQLGIPALLKMTIKGVGRMPARGGCFECSDEQLAETIQYILEKS